MYDFQSNSDFVSSLRGKRYGFNGQEKDDEVYDASGTSYTAEFWQYDSRLGRRWNIDPAFAEKSWMSTYHAFSNKAILNIDPNGANDDEYQVNGETGEMTKVSDLGGSAVNFYHYQGGEKDGKTEIEDSNTCETQLMSTSKFITGYTRRDKNTNWETLLSEFNEGTGPEKSLIYQEHPMNFQIIHSPTFIEAMQSFVESGETKYSIAPFFNPGKAGSNMTAQFIGKANYSFYEVGNKLVIVVIDSKSISSKSINPFAKGEERNVPRESDQIIPNSTTHQTYLFIMDKSFKNNYEKK